MQVVTAVHDTPSSWLALPGCCGVGVIDQVKPFHRSARVRTLSPKVAEPTAVHVLADAQDTADSCGNGSPVGLGLGCTFHAVPLKCSTSVPAEEPPTAVHADAVVQATPARVLILLPAGLGTGSRVHDVPFHRSASVTDGMMPDAPN